VLSARLTPGRANRQSAANAGSLVQARDKDAARAAGNRNRMTDRMDFDWIGFMVVLLFGVVGVFFGVD